MKWQSKDTVIVFVNIVVKCKPMTLTLKMLFGNWAFNLSNIFSLFLDL